MPQNEGKASATSVAASLANLEQKIGEVLDELRQRLPPASSRAEWELAYRYLSSRYGWGYDELAVVGTIDAQGGITIERRITVTARSLLLTLEQSLNVRPPEHEKIQTLTKDSVVVFPQTYGTDVTAGDIFPLNDGWVIKLLFDPPVPPSSTVTFVLRENLPPGTYAVGYTDEQLREEDITDQWFNWRLDRPTLRFKARVNFPGDYLPRGYVHRVFFPPVPKDIANARRHAEEETRLANLFKLSTHANTTGERATLELDVDLPILGLQYMIRWDPLKKKLVPPPGTDPGDSSPGELAAIGTAGAPVKRSRLFISYSHHDANLLKRLQIHLKPWERAGLIDRWDDTKIDPGGKWKQEIRHAIDAAKVALLLVSADFLASDFIMQSEVPPLLKAAQDEGAVIIPIIVSPSSFSDIEALAQFQAINSPHTPLRAMNPTEREELLVRVAQKVRDALSLP